jgi:hypothetical protein
MAPKDEKDEEDTENLVDVGLSVSDLDIGIDAPLDVRSESRNKAELGHPAIFN